MKIKELDLIKYQADLNNLPAGKLLINTINAHSFNVAKEDSLFRESLLRGGCLLPDGFSIVLARKLLNKENIERIAGADLFRFEMEKLNQQGGDCFFLGSSDAVLAKITEKARLEYPNIRIHTYSPPYKPVFSTEENELMIQAVNQVRPDLLWVGMTAPKQEKWAYENYESLNVRGHIGCIGAVFDFYAGNVRRAPQWMMDNGLEWLHRLCSNPKRLWRRYLIGNTRFITHVIKEWA